VNIALKINEKLGGMNTTVSPEFLGVVAKDPTMIFGADVNHAR
jgi:hypothetical protein